MPAPRSRYITERSAEITGWTNTEFRMPRKMEDRYREPSTLNMDCCVFLHAQGSQLAGKCSDEVD